MFKIVATVLVMLNGAPVFDETMDREDDQFQTMEQCNARLAEVRDDDRTLLTAHFRPAVEGRWGEEAVIEVTVNCVPVVKQHAQATPADPLDGVSSIFQQMNQCGGMAAVARPNPCNTSRPE